MTIDSFLAEFGRRLGLGTLQFNDDGVCRLVFDGELTVDVEHQHGEPMFHLASVVGPLPDATDPALLAALLDANYMGRRTGGATLAIDVLNGDVVLCRTLPSDDLSYEVLEGVIEAFVAAIETWTDELADLGARPARTAAPAEADVIMMRI